MLKKADWVLFVVCVGGVAAISACSTVWKFMQALPSLLTYADPLA